MASPGTPATTKPKTPHAAPVAPVIPSATSGLSTDLYGLSSQGIGDLANIPIQGAYEFFGQPAYQAGKTITKSSKAQYPSALAPMTAQQAIQSFVHLTGQQLAQVQDQLYRGGFYSSTYVPSYGQIQAEDLSAFRQMMIGLASNPTQGTLSDYLQKAAQLGDQNGLNVKKRAPLVVHLTNPDDLRLTLQKTAQTLYGGNLPESDVQAFISSYQSLQSGAAQQTYAAGESPTSGAPIQYDANGNPIGAGGTVASAASPDTAAEMYIRRQHPVEVGTEGFVNAMDGILNTFTQSKPGATGVSL